MLYDEFVAIGTDTLACHPYREGDKCLEPLLFTTKVYHLPHLKSAFACTGYQILGFKFYEFVNRFIIGKDLNGLLQADIGELKKFMDFDNQRFGGRLFVYGFDETLGVFRGSHCRISERDTENVWTEIKSNSQIDGVSFVLQPLFDKLHEEIENSLPDSAKHKEYIKTAITIQKQKDSKMPLNEQVGIGGDIVFTQMFLTEENKFMIASEVIYEFPDKEEIGEIMMKRIAS